jgi:hypothetical protein
MTSKGYRRGKLKITRKSGGKRSKARKRAKARRPSRMGW